MTDGELFDLLVRDFGVGDWDEATSPQPYWKWRAIEVGKIKRVRTARKVRLDDLALAAEYCKAHGYDVRDATWLYKHVLPALRWDRERRAVASTSSFEEQMATAVGEAYAAGDMDWVGRLTRAQGATREQVLAEWRNR